ncbi:hypothetical protein [Tumebacillus permanentifrigoris]|uniref:Uncharacterized protein n=1 Tax=Tumebacillus permanentifrigoris TaxID=378543 RepID=A0A316DXA0_9BACL|nr:hypothetical protein [Tumebacillus permanentifrigoris]PWK14464.1 hypothetical protein C7459_105223 [Tumebacillus permanentifrigoris]
MATLLLFLPRLFQFFGTFRGFYGFLRPFWPMISGMFGSRAAI